MKIRKDSRVLAEVNLYVRIKILVARHWTLIAPSLRECRHSVAAAVQNLPYSAVKSIIKLAMNKVDASGQTIRLLIRLSLDVSFLEVMHIKGK